MDKLHTSGNNVSSFGLNFKIRASEVGSNLHKVKIYISEEGEDKQIGFFIIDTYSKTIYRGLRHGSLLTLMGINPSDEYNYEVHMHLIERHNLFIKKRFNKFNIDDILGDKYYYLDENGNVKISNRNKYEEDVRIKNFLAFPTAELAVRAKNYHNRVHRYLLLWLYQNNSELNSEFDANEVCYYLETKDDYTFELKIKEWTEEEDVDDKDLIYETPETGPLMKELEYCGFIDLLNRGYGRSLDAVIEDQNL